MKSLIDRASVVLWPEDEMALRRDKIVQAIDDAGADALLVSSNANKFYLAGRVFCGYIYITRDARVTYFVRRPSGLVGDNVIYIRKPEDIAAHISGNPGVLALEFQAESYAVIQRLANAIPHGTLTDGSAFLAQARRIKTPFEIETLAESGRLHTAAYADIPSLYRKAKSANASGDVTDLDILFETEYLLRRKGCLGQFRINGTDMELHMGNILAGDNADTPSPYDFAMGGAGQHPSLPVGADGTVIAQGMTVMVDANGNFTGYMTDMTRCFSLGDPHPLAVRANNVSRRICREIADAARPGVKAADLYALALSIAEEENLADSFMGHNYHAGFVGHGLGIAINEGPVLAPRSRDVLAAGNVFALEPKFVIPGIGAAGIENTYVVMHDGPARCLTTAPEDILPFDI